MKTLSLVLLCGLVLGGCKQEPKPMVIESSPKLLTAIFENDGSLLYVRVKKDGKEYLVFEGVEKHCLNDFSDNDVLDIYSQLKLNLIGYRTPSRVKMLEAVGGVVKERL